MASDYLFNYEGPGVQQAAANVLAQFNLAQETLTLLNTARGKIEAGAWRGPGSDAFIQDSEKLSAEIVMYLDMLAAFMTRLNNAAGNTDDTAAQVLNMVNQIP